MIQTQCQDTGTKGNAWCRPPRHVNEATMPEIRQVPLSGIQNKILHILSRARDFYLRTQYSELKCFDEGHGNGTITNIERESQKTNSMQSVPVTCMIFTS